MKKALLTTLLLFFTLSNFASTVTVNSPSSVSGMKSVKSGKTRFYYSSSSNYNPDDRAVAKASFVIKVKKEGFYDLEAFVQARNSSSNSFYVVINELFPKTWSISTSSKAKWRKIRHVYLKAGSNRINFFARESNTRVGKVRAKFRNSLRRVMSMNFDNGILPPALVSERKYLKVRNKRLEVDYIPSSKGSERISARKSFSPSDDFTLTYRVRFDHDFQFVKSGKLHGLGPKNPTTGCDARNSKGWSSRVTFGEMGQPKIYIYDQNRAVRCGRSFYSKDDFVFEPGRWHRVSLFTRVNSKGKSDGVAKLFVDGKQLIEVRNLRFRYSSSKESEIQNFLFSTFHGGSNSTYSPTRKVEAEFDSFAVFHGEVSK